MFYSLMKPIAFALEPETAHNLILKSAAKAPMLGTFFRGAKRDKKYQLNQKSWSFPLGIAAGLDKNAEAIDFFFSLGFGAIEVGTVTLKPQAGNPKPRIWRYKKSEDLRNAMGFPNHGSEVIKKNILKSQFIKSKEDRILGINLGKNKDSNFEESLDEYAKLFDLFAPLADYLVVNLSSPNTAGLREMQGSEFFARICEKLKPLCQKYSKPLYLKIAPELDPDNIKKLLEILDQYQWSGLIATNTSLNHNYDRGGLSGKSIFEESRKTRNLILSLIKDYPKLELIGVGGFSNPQQMKDFWALGGEKVQIYTSFIFQGPKILQDTQDFLKREFQRYQVADFKSYLLKLRKSQET